MDLEDRSRRNNLLIFGVDERPDETSDSIIDTVVKDIFSDILKVKVSSAERIHRIGRKVANKSRPVIVKFVDHRKKEQVLRNCNKLKGTPISISEDFSKATRETRKKLWDDTATIRARGGKVRLAYTKIKVDDVLYKWDDDHQVRIPVNKLPERRDDQPGRVSP